MRWLKRAGYHRTCVSRGRSPISTAKRRVARIHVAEALSYRGETLRRAQARGVKFFSSLNILGQAATGRQCPRLSHSIRIGLLTGPCCGRIGAAALVALLQSRVASRGRLNFQRALLRHGNEADTRAHRGAIPRQPDVSGLMFPCFPD